MPNPDWTIDPDIRRAATLPAEVYSDPRYFEAARERIFTRSWQIVADTDAVRVPGQNHPFTLLAELLAEVDARVSWMPLAQATLDPTRSRDYLVRANWALYCDNYLEGFHIPYVHAALADALDYGEYRTELFPWANLQIGVASGGEDTFDLPPSSPDHGQNIAGYYFWLFPNTMLNFYPWGISVNIVRPLAPDRTKVSFLSYVWDPTRLDRGAGAGLDRV